MDLAENTTPATPIELDYFESKVKSKYPYMTIEDIADIVNKAKLFYYSAKFPCDPNVDEKTRPIVSFIGQNWVLACCDELIERLGFSSAVGYKENGVSWSFGNAQVSDRLLSLIKPTIGTIG